MKFLKLNLVLIFHLLLCSSQEYNQAYMKLVHQNRDIPSNSTVIIKWIQSDKKGCFLACNIEFWCRIVIIRSNGFCILCKKDALSQLIVSSESTSVWHNSKSFDVITDGLVNYWPIRNDLLDYKGTSNMTPGESMEPNGSVGFGPDRFGNPTGALYINRGYYQVPSGVYFTASFSILVWIKLVSFEQGNYLLDFGNGINLDNVALWLIDVNTKPQPSFGIIHEVGGTNVFSYVYLELDEWYHIASVMNGGDAYLYVNGEEVAYTMSSFLTPNVTRQKCYFGRSGDGDNAHLYYDEIKFYNRPLSKTEILYDIDTFIY